MTQKHFNCADQAAPTWLQRAEICGRLLSAISPRDGARLLVADIGCGDRKLRDVLDSCSFAFEYSGYDLQPQAPEVEQFDVRSDMLTRRYDVIVMLGVIEYIEGLAGVLQRLAGQVPHLVLSHVVRRGDTYSPARLVELGWVNHLSVGELERLLVNCGYTISARQMTPDDRTLLVSCDSQVHGRVA